jgi:hypothetical protein
MFEVTSFESFAWIYVFCEPFLAHIKMPRLYHSHVINALALCRRLASCRQLAPTMAIATLPGRLAQSWTVHDWIHWKTAFHLPIPSNSPNCTISYPVNDTPKNPADWFKNHLDLLCHRTKAQHLNLDALPLAWHKWQWCGYWEAVLINLYRSQLVAYEKHAHKYTDLGTIKVEIDLSVLIWIKIALHMFRCAGLLAWWMLKTGTPIYTFHNIGLTKASLVSSEM